MGQLLRFPTQQEHYRAAASQVAPLVSTGWAETRLPVLAAGLQLLELSEPQFAARMALMRDESGVGLVAELIHELESTSTDLEALYRAAYLIRTRLRSALSALEPVGATS